MEGKIRAKVVRAPDIFEPEETMQLKLPTRKVNMGAKCNTSSTGQWLGREIPVWKPLKGSSKEEVVKATQPV